MCKFKSGIIFKNRIVLAPKGDESHFLLLKSLNIEDNYFNSNKIFVKVELFPINDNKVSDISEWQYVVDQDMVPDWYSENPGKYEKEFREAVAEWMKENAVIVAGKIWTAIKTDDKGTYYLSNCAVAYTTFGKSNNYAESNVRRIINENSLAQRLKEEFGDRLVPISTNLFSLDGFEEYGTVEGDILALPTLDLYRECRKNILVYRSWWLATPFSTPSGWSSSRTLHINAVGNVNWNDCDRSDWIRPFFILSNN